MKPTRVLRNRLRKINKTIFRPVKERFQRFRAVEWLTSFLFGDDIFISYSRDGGIAYAEMLARNLSKEFGYSCRLDLHETLPGRRMPKKLLRGIQRCRMLIVIATDRATESVHVEKEIKLYKRTHRENTNIIPIDFGGVLKAIWFPRIDGLPPGPVESVEALSAAAPSKHVMERISDSFDFTRRNRRLFISSVASFILLITLLTLGIAASVYAGVQFKLAEDERANAEAARATADNARAEATRAMDVAEQARQETLRQQKLVDEAKKEVEIQTGLASDARQEAEKQRGIANYQLEQANKQQQLARQARLEADKQTRRAEEQAKKAELEGRKATSRELLARAQDARFQGADKFLEPVSLAVQAYNVFKSSEPEPLFRYGLDKLPRPLACLPHDKQVNDLAFDREGKKLFTSTSDKVREWDWKSGSELRSFTISESAVTGKMEDRVLQKFSSHGDYLTLIVKDNNEKAEVWRVSDGKKVNDIQHQKPIDYFAYSVNGRFLVTTSEDMLQVLELGKSAPVTPPIDHENQPIKKAAISPNGQVVASVSKNPNEDNSHVLRIAQTDTGEDLLPAQYLSDCFSPFRGNPCLESLEFSSDGKYLALVRHGTVNLYNLERRKVLTPLEAGPLVKSISFSISILGETMLAVGSGNGLDGEESEVRLYELKGETVTDYDERMKHSGIIKQIAFVPGEASNAIESLLTVTNNTAHLWSYNSSNRVESARMHHADEIDGIAFYRGSDRKLIMATAGREGIARVWEETSNETNSLLKGEQLKSFVSQNKRYMATSSQTGTRVFDTDDGKLVGIIQAKITDAAVSNDGRYVYDQSGSPKMWNVAANQPIPLPELERLPQAAASADLRYIALKDKENFVIVQTDDKTVKPLELPKEIDKVYFSPDNQHIATVERESNSVQLWKLNVERNFLQRKFSRPFSHDGRVNSVVFSSTGEFLLVRSVHKLTLWRQNGEKITSLKDTAARFKATFSLNDRYAAILIHSFGDIVMRVLETSSGKEIKKVNEISYGTPVLSHNGDYLAFSDGLQAFVWSVHSEKLIAKINYATAIENISFNSNSRYLIIATMQQVEQALWNPEDLVEEVKSRLRVANDGCP